jgi:hypothetical protein
VADPGCLSRIPDPTFFYPGSRILIKEFKYLTYKKAKKWFLSRKKYDPGCSSRIPDPDADFLPSWIPDPGVKKVPYPIPDPGSATLKKRFLSSKKYDPGCSSPIRMLTFSHPGSGIRIRNTGCVIYWVEGKLTLFYSIHLYAVLWTRAGIHLVAEDPDTDKDQKS